MERVVKVGGVDGVSCILVVKILGIFLLGIIFYVVILIVGFIEKVVIVYDKVILEDLLCIIFVDIFKDEV